MIPTILSSEEEAKIDAFWQQQPRRPRVPGATLPPIPFAAVTARITCRVCGTREEMPINWDGIICRQCRSDLHATKLHVMTERTKIDHEMQAQTDAWLTFLTEQDDATSERYTMLVQTRQRAQTRLERAMTGKQSANVPEANYAIERAAAKADYEALQAKIERTRAKGDALAAVLEREALHLEAMKALGEARLRWELALEEIEAAEGSFPL